MQTADIQNALAEMEPIEAIHMLLDTASVIADGAAADETHASDPYTALAQLIDNALARAENLRAKEGSATEADLSLRYPLEDWQYEVANGDTRRGYDDWCRAKAEADA